MCFYYFSFLQLAQSVRICVFRECVGGYRRGEGETPEAPATQYSSTQSDGFHYANLHVEDISLPPLKHEIPNCMLSDPEDLNR